MFVGDTYNQRVQVLNPDFTFSHMFSSNRQEKFCLDVTADSKGFAYVTDCTYSRVQKFTIEGQLVSSFCTDGSKPGQLHKPTGITVDDNNDLLCVNNNGAY